MLCSAIIIFLASWIIIFCTGPYLIKSLSAVAKFLGWREFVVAFFTIAIGGSIPNLFVDISSAIRGIPELAFGDILGGNLVDLTLVVGLAVFIAKTIPAGSRMVQMSALFTAAIAVLPLLLIVDGVLGRGDGLILILVFVFYASWLFSKKERFTKVYDGATPAFKKDFRNFLKNIAGTLLGMGLLVAAAQGIVGSSQVISQNLGLPLSFIGLTIIGFGNCLPEFYFTIICAKKEENWLILGDLMGSVIICATLVLGIVALVSPIEVERFSPFALARIFLLLAALFFFFFLRTGRKITRREGIFLVSLYFAFLFLEILLTRFQ